MIRKLQQYHVLMTWVSSVKCFAISIAGNFGTGGEAPWDYEAVSGPC